MTTISPIRERPTVLMLEDDPAVRRSMQLLLQGRGFNVRAYSSPGPLLADEAAASAVCLVADYRLQEGDGIAALGSLRSAGFHCPAILVTAFPSQQVHQSALAAGFAEVLEKPLREHVLVHTVSRVSGHWPDVAK